MTEPISIATSVLTAVGVGGALGAFLQARFQQRAQVSQHEHEEKHTRYRCIHILTQARLYPRVGLPKLRQTRPDIQTIEDLDFELGAELLTAVVFADAEVIEALSTFIQQPNQTAFVRVGIAMRNDLWGKRRGSRVDLSETIGKALATCSGFADVLEQPASADSTLNQTLAIKTVSSRLPATVLLTQANP